MDDEPSLAHLHPNTIVTGPRVSLLITKKAKDDFWHCWLTYHKDLFFNHTREERHAKIRQAYPLYFDKFQWVDETKITWVA